MAAAAAGIFIFHGAAEIYSAVISRPLLASGRGRADGPAALLMVASERAFGLLCTCIVY